MTTSNADKNTEKPDPAFIAGGIQNGTFYSHSGKIMTVSKKFDSAVAFQGIYFRETKLNNYKKMVNECL